MLIIFTTVSSSEQGEILAEKLVDRKLAACVQVLPQMTSVYFWDGAVQKETEHLLLIKTTEELFQPVSDFLAENHPYTTPEIVAVDTDKASEPYKKWVDDYLRR